MSLDRPPAWLAPLERLEAKLRSKPSVADATVVSVDPIRVQLDGKPSPVAPSPSTVVPVAVGDRVWVMHHGKTRLRIIGVIGGRGRVPYAMDAGRAVVPVADGIGTIDVAFTPGTFTRTPQVTLTGETTAVQISRLATQSISATGFTISLSRSGDFGTAVDWIAVQMTP